MPKATCTVTTPDGPCPNDAVSKGLCNAHGKRLRESGDVQAHIPIQRKRRGVTEECSRDGCREPYEAKGLCKRHYAEERAARLAEEECENPQCHNPRGTTGGYCPACYQRSALYGDPNAGPPRRKRKSVITKGAPAGTRSQYHVNHANVRKERGPAHLHGCERCPDQAETWAQIHDSSGESPKDYMALCWPCHARYDEFVNRLPDNTGSKRTPEQRDTMRRAARARWADPAAHEKMSEVALRREARRRAEREGDVA